MKFNLSDFLELDTTQLLVVNGGSPCGTGSSAPSGSTDSSGGSNGGNGGSSNVTYNSNGTVTYHQKNGQSFTYRTKGSSSSSSSGGGYCSGASDGKTIYANPYYGGNKSSTNGKSNNPQGQGSAKTSSVPNVGGNCSAASSADTNGGTTAKPAIPASGTFGQITDGSYADNLTMQYYADGNTEIGPFYNETPEMAKMHDLEMNGNNKFSESGCLMTCAAKVISEKSGKQVYLTEVNSKIDTNSDGLLSFEEIESGLERFLGDDYNIEGHWYEGSLSKETFAIAASKDDTYVLARAYGDFDGDGKSEHHWVVLEGYTTDALGRLVFSYDGSSNNDVGRTYLYGNADSSKKEFAIDKIETFTITKK